MASTNPAPNGYYNRPSDDLWWAIFTRDNPKVDYQQNQVRVSQMLVNDNGDTRRNTSGKLIAIPGMGREGEDWLTWNRPFMEVLFKDKEVWVPPNQQRTLGELVEDFNRIWKFQLSPRDFYDQNIEITQFPSTYEIQIRPTCLCFQGVLTIHVGNPDVHIGEVIINHDLSGLDYPTLQSKKSQGPFHVFERDFTFAGSKLKSEFNYDDLISADQFDYLKDLFEQVWVYQATTANWNLKGAKVIYNGTTAAAPGPVNTDRTNVLMVLLDPVLNSNVAGHLSLHYDVLLP